MLAQQHGSEPPVPLPVLLKLKLQESKCRYWPHSRAPTHPQVSSEVPEELRECRLPAVFKEEWGEVKPCPRIAGGIDLQGFTAGGA